MCHKGIDPSLHSLQRFNLGYLSNGYRKYKKVKAEQLSARNAFLNDQKSFRVPHTKQSLDRLLIFSPWTRMALMTTLGSIVWDSGQPPWLLLAANYSTWSFPFGHWVSTVEQELVLWRSGQSWCLHLVTSSTLFYENSKIPEYILLTIMLISWYLNILKCCFCFYMLHSAEGGISIIPVSFTWVW